MEPGSRVISKRSSPETRPGEGWRNCGKGKLRTSKCPQLSPLPKHHMQRMAASSAKQTSPERVFVNDQRPP